MHADEYGERPTRTAAPFRVVTTGSSVGRSVRLFFEMKRHLRMLPERRRCQEHGTVDLLSQRVPVPTRLPTELLRLRSWSEYELSGWPSESDASQGKVSHSVIPGLWDSLVETSRPLRETSMVSPNSIFWPKGVVQRMRTGRRMRKRRCSRLSARVTVLPMGISVARTFLNCQDLVLGQESLIFALQFA